MSEIKPEMKAVMIAAADKAAPREACGLVWGEEVREVTNVAKNGGGFFIMDYEEQVVLYNELGRPDGVWHSHPNGDPLPSESDLHYHPDGMRMYIVAGGEVINHGIPG